MIGNPPSHLYKDVWTFLLVLMAAVAGGELQVGVVQRSSLQTRTLEATFCACALMSGILLGLKVWSLCTRGFLLVMEAGGLQVQ